MWISKKKYENQLWETKRKAMDAMHENEQWDRIEKLEKQVKKLKKRVKNGY